MILPDLIVIVPNSILSSLMNSTLLFSIVTIVKMQPKTRRVPPADSIPSFPRTSTLPTESKMKDERKTAAIHGLKLKRLIFICPRIMHCQLHFQADWRHRQPQLQ